MRAKQTICIHNSDPDNAGVKLCEYQLLQGRHTGDKRPGVVEFIKEDFDQFYQLLPRMRKARQLSSEIA